MVASNTSNGIHWKNVVLWAFSILLPAVCAWIWAIDREVIRLDEVQKSRAPAYSSITGFNADLGELRADVEGLKQQTQDTRAGVARVESQVDRLVEHLLRYDGVAPTTPRNGDRR